MDPVKAHVGTTHPSADIQNPYEGPKLLAKLTEKQSIQTLNSRGGVTHTPKVS